MRQIIQLEVEFENREQNNLVFKWKFPENAWKIQDDPIYLVPKDILYYFVDLSRKRLTEFVNVIIDEDAGLVDDEKYIAAIKKLLTTGTTLCQKIFPLNDYVASAAKELLNSLDDNYYIHIIIRGPGISIPWNLIFQGKYDQQVKSRDELDAHVKYFWGIRYTPIISSKGTLNSTPFKESELITFSGGDIEEIYNNMQPIEQSIFTCFSTHPNRHTFNYDEFWDLINPSDRGTIAHVVTHYLVGDKIDIGDEKEEEIADLLEKAITKITSSSRLPSRVIDQSHFSLPISLPVPRRNFLWIFNMCGTSSVGSEQKIASRFADEGLGWYIATETLIPTQFAVRFMQAFLFYLLIEKKNIQQATEILWKKHAPLSLIYRIFCPPDFMFNGETSIPPNQKLEYSKLVTSDKYRNVNVG